MKGSDSSKTSVLNHWPISNVSSLPCQTSCQQIYHFNCVGISRECQVDNDTDHRAKHCGVNYFCQMVCQTTDRGRCGSVKRVVEVVERIPFARKLSCVFAVPRAIVVLLVYCGMGERKELTCNNWFHCQTSYRSGGGLWF